MRRSAMAVTTREIAERLLLPADLESVVQRAA
jgi:hypothetical protein